MKMATASIAISAAPVSKASVWSGRILTAIMALFLVFDGVTKIFKERHVLAAAAEMGIAVNTIVWIGALLLVCTALYLIPRTSLFGAMLLTAYLGGAVCANVMAHHPPFQVVFPVIFGTLVWASLYLRDPRLWDLAPIRKD